MARKLIGLMSVAVILGAVGVASAVSVPAEDFSGPEWVNDGDNIVGTNGWLEMGGLGKLSLGTGVAGGNAATGSGGFCCDLLSIPVIGGPLTSGTIVTTFFSRKGTIGNQVGYSDSNSRNFNGMGVEAPHHPNHGLAMEPFTTGNGVSVGLPNVTDNWVQYRYTYNRDTNFVSLEFRDVDDTTGLPLGTGAYGAGPSGDRNAHSFAPIDVTHFWWGAGNSSGLALINVEVPEPTSLALLGVGVGSLLLMRRRRRA